jgi:hypothetical protein
MAKINKTPISTNKLGVAVCTCGPQLCGSHRPALGKNVRLYLNVKQEMDGGMAQVVKHLPRCPTPKKGRRVKRKVSYHPAILFLGVYPKEHKSQYKRDTCIPLFLTALFTIGK